MDEFHLDFLNVLMQLPCNVYWVNKHGVTLGCNQNVADFLKVDSVDDVIGKSHHQLYRKEDAERFDETLKEIIDSGKAIQIQETAKLSDGKTYCYQSFKSPLKDDNGNIIGVIGVSFDTTQDKTEISLLKHIISVLPGHVWWTDKKNNLLGCNLNMAQTFGFGSIEQIIGMDTFHLLHNSSHVDNKNTDYRQYDKDDLHVIEDDVTLEKEELVTIDGKLHSFLSSKAPLKDLDGKTIGLVGVAQNITDNTTERKVLKHVLSMMPGHVWWTDKDGLILGCNDLMAQRFGFKNADDLIGKSTKCLLPTSMSELEKDKIAEETAEIDKRIMETGKPFVGEESLDLDGEEKTFYSHKLPIHDLDGVISGTVGIAQDITELKAAQAIAERASAVKSEFIANMSHDFRTPITGMLGEAEYIETHAKDKDIQECGGFLRQATQQLLRLTNSILEFVSLESGEIDEPVAVFNPKEVLEQVMTLMRVTLRQKTLELKLTVAPDVPKVVKGYAQSFERIVNNLVANAIKFTENGSVKLSLTATSPISEEVNLKLTVEDTGMGIPADKHEEIFEQFSKLSSSYQGLFDGTGLGLYAVKQYVGQMQGLIKVDSVVGKGSKFTVILPFDKAVAAETVSLNIKKRPRPTETSQPANAQACQVQQLHPVHKQKTKVLVVEDAPLPARAVIRLLNDFNCEVKLVKSGEEALKAVVKKVYDIILMDIGLPGIDGVETTRRIRALPKNNDMPIVALTGHVRGKKKPECMEAGMQDVYSKPLTRNQLKFMLKTYVVSDSDEGTDIMKTPFATHVLDIEGMMGVFQTEDPTQLLDMFEAAVDYIPEELDRLKAAVAIEDFETIKASVHSIKGGMAYISASECNDLIANWDEILRHEKPAKVALEMMYEQIERVLINLRDAMLQAIELVNKND